jgi:tRNA threonylcarbamoyladenosine biosynthesis protein TsaB
MVSLGVDTSTPAGSVALVEDDRILGEVNLAAGRHHQVSLLRSVDLLLDLAGVGMDRVDVLGVGLGPGTFTGLRIGIATVKGLSLARGVPAYGLSSLCAMALLHREGGLPVAPLIDAGRREVYAALFGSGEEVPRTLRGEQGGPPRPFLEGLPAGPLLFCGDGARAYRDLILQVRGAGDRLDPEPCFLGRALARWAIRQLREKSPWSLGALKPNYIRPPDVEAPPRI